MRVFVTGGTGFIGKKTIERLIDSGQECVCLIRNPKKQTVLNDLGVQFANGDVTDKQSLVEGMKGCAAVVNLANVFSLWEPDVSLYEKVNIDGTRNVMEAALTALAGKGRPLSADEIQGMIVAMGYQPSIERIQAYDA